MRENLHAVPGEEEVVFFLRPVLPDAPLPCRFSRNFVPFLLSCHWRVTLLSKLSSVRPRRVEQQFLVGVEVRYLDGSGTAVVSSVGKVDAAVVVRGWAGSAARLLSWPAELLGLAVDDDHSKPGRL